MRSMFTSTDNASVISLKFKTSPEYSSAVQGLGRLVRHEDNTAILLVHSLMHQSHLRFSTPPLPVGLKYDQVLR